VFAEDGDEKFAFVAALISHLFGNILQNISQNVFAKNYVDFARLTSGHLHMAELDCFKN